MQLFSILLAQEWTSDRSEKWRWTALWEIKLIVIIMHSWLHSGKTNTPFTTTFHFCLEAVFVLSSSFLCLFHFISRKCRNPIKRLNLTLHTANNLLKLNSNLIWFCTWISLSKSGEKCLQCLFEFFVNRECFSNMIGISMLVFLKRSLLFVFQGLPCCRSSSIIPFCSHLMDCWNNLWPYLD